MSAPGVTHAGEPGSNVRRAAWLLALCAGVAAPYVLLQVIALGRNIPQAAMEADYVLAVAWALLIGLSIAAWPVPARDKGPLALIWAVKALVALAFMLLYEAYYQQLDSYQYFDQARIGRFDWDAFTIGAGTENIINLVRLQAAVLGPSFHALKVTFALVGLAAVYLTYRAAVIYTGRPDRRLLYILAFFPSILFWSSILGKDPLVLLGIALYTYGVVSWWEHRGVAGLVVAAAGIFLATFIRVWLGPLLLLPLLAFAWVAARTPARRLALLTAVAVALALALGRFLSALQLDSVEDVIATANFVSRAWAYGGSAQVVNVDFGNPLSVLAFLPVGAFTALFRPLPGEIMNPFGLLAGLENLALLGLLGYALVRGRLAELRSPVVLWAVLLVVCWALLYGVVSYQNLGAAVRFKLQVLPLMVALLLHFASSDRPISTTMKDAER